MNPINHALGNRIKDSHQLHHWTDERNLAYVPRRRIRHFLTATAPDWDKLRFLRPRIDRKVANRNPKVGRMMSEGRSGEAMRKDRGLHHHRSLDRR